MESDHVKKWILRKVRAHLRGTNVTEKVTAFANGTLSEYRFMLEIVLNDGTRQWVSNPANAVHLEEERL